ncbi:MAG: hypothetical protein HY683_01870 [Chloroflexi bacterium]|nr:hypothetical protein [Chloroflexota bacterium]
MLRRWQGTLLLAAALGLALTGAACRQGGTPTVGTPNPGHPTPEPATPTRAQDTTIVGEVKLAQGGLLQLASSTPQGDRLLVAKLASNPSPDCGLWLVDLGRGTAQKLSNDSPTPFPLALFSPDSQEALFYALDGCSPDPTELAKRPTNLWKLDLASGQASTLEPGGPPYRWLAEAGIIFERRVEGSGNSNAPQTQLWQMSGDSSQARVFSPLPLGLRGDTDFRALVSPSGDRIAYLESRFPPPPANPVYQVALLAPDGTSRVELSGVPFQFSPEAWSPAGTRFLYAKLLESGAQLWAREVATGRDVLLLDKLTTGSTALAWRATWAPDGQALILEGRQLYVLNANGSGLRPLTPAGQEYSEVRWGEDGRHLFFERQSGDGGQELWVAVLAHNKADLPAAQEELQRLQAGPWPLTLVP